jgi:hypothetical protein
MSVFAWRLGRLAMVAVVLAGCGMVVRPRLGSETGRPPVGSPGEPDLGPVLAPDVGGREQEEGLIRQICRNQSVPHGWLIIKYAQGDDRCPAPADRDNPFTVAIIERYEDKPLESIMTVCADQKLPTDWIRMNQVSGHECPGARVPANAPSVYVIRRVR